MLFRFIFKRKKKIRKYKQHRKFDLNNWMNLTKEERLKVDFLEKDESMKKKKALLKSIREEYFKIKKNID